MQNKFKKILALTLSTLTLMGTTAFALSTESTTGEVVLEDNRNLTPKGNAELMDDVTDNEELQFITVTARDGNVFYFVIDHGAESENVYFLNVVDEEDLKALTDGEKIESTEAPGFETQEPEPEIEPINDVEEDKKSDNNIPLLLILLLVAGVGVGAYYYKVILPKKKIDEADDIEDFEFGESEDDEDKDDDLPEDEELEEEIEKADEAYGTDKK